MLRETLQITDVPHTSIPIVREIIGKDQLE
jgi:hypothetical protein